MYYLLLILSAALFASQFLFNQLFRKQCGSSSEASLLFMLYTSLAGFFLIFVINGFRLEFSVFSLWIAVLCSVVNLLYTAASLKAFETVNLSVYSVFSMLGGMLLPSVFGILFRDETLTTGKLVCFLFICAALFFTTDRRAKKSKNAYFYYAAVFLLNGFTGVLSVIHQSGASAVDSCSYLMHTRLISLLLSAAIYALKYRSFPSISVRPILCCAAFALTCSLGNLFVLIALKHIDASVQYPLITGGVMLFSLLISIIRRERVTKRETFASVAAFIASVILVW